MLKDEIEKKNSIKKMTKKTRVNLTNLQNSQPRLWDCDTTYKANKNNNYETQFSINSMLKDEIEKKN